LASWVPQTIAVPSAGTRHGVPGSAREDFLYVFKPRPRTGDADRRGRTGKRARRSRLRLRAGTHLRAAGFRADRTGGEIDHSPRGRDSLHRTDRHQPRFASRSGQGGSPIARPPVSRPGRRRDREYRVDSGRSSRAAARTAGMGRWREFRSHVIGVAIPTRLVSKRWNTAWPVRQPDHRDAAVGLIRPRQHVVCSKHIFRKCLFRLRIV
jgi:hypothetical protein